MKKYASNDYVKKDIKEDVALTRDLKFRSAGGQYTLAAGTILTATSAYGPMRGVLSSDLPKECQKCTQPTDILILKEGEWEQAF